MSGASPQLGFVTETAGSVLEEPPLVDLLTAAISALSGIPAALVRPRWQPLPPNQPAANVDWCSVGITQREPAPYAYFAHDPTGNGGLGQDVLTEWESLSVLCSVYGVNAYANAGRLRRGLNVGQNRDSLAAAGIRLTSIGTTVAVPDLINLQFVDHVDLPLVFARVSTSVFEIETMQTATVSLTTDSLLTEIETTTSASTPLLPP